MEFEVGTEIIEKFPNIAIGVVRGAVDSVPEDVRATISELRREAEAKLSSRGLSSETILENPHIAAWRWAYQQFGVKAKSHKPTHEALARRLLKGEGWPSINPIVDIYLTNQIAHLLPHGGYDADSLTGALKLTMSPGGESFDALGGEKETTNPGEVIYRDNARIVTRRWNYRDCEVTKIRPDSRRFVLMIESPSELISPEEVEAAATDLVTRYEGSLRGRFTSTIVRPTQSNRLFEL